MKITLFISRVPSTAVLTLKLLLLIFILCFIYFFFKEEIDSNIKENYITYSLTFLKCCFYILNFVWFYLYTIFNLDVFFSSYTLPFFTGDNIGDISTESEDEPLGTEIREQSQSINFASKPSDYSPEHLRTESAAGNSNSSEDDGPPFGSRAPEEQSPDNSASGVASSAGRGDSSTPSSFGLRGPNLEARPAEVSSTSVSGDCGSGSRASAEKGPEDSSAVGGTGAIENKPQKEEKRVQLGDTVRVRKIYDADPEDRYAIEYSDEKDVPTNTLSQEDPGFVTYRDKFSKTHLVPSDLHSSSSNAVYDDAYYSDTDSDVVGGQEGTAGIPAAERSKANTWYEDMLQKVEFIKESQNTIKTENNTKLNKDEFSQQYLQMQSIKNASTLTQDLAEDESGTLRGTGIQKDEVKVKRSWLYEVPPALREAEEKKYASTSTQTQDLAEDESSILRGTGVEEGETGYAAGLTSTQTQDLAENESGTLRETGVEEDETKVEEGESGSSSLATRPTATAHGWGGALEDLDASAQVAATPTEQARMAEPEKGEKRSWPFENDDSEEKRTDKKSKKKAD